MKLRVDRHGSWLYPLATPHVDGRQSVCSDRSRTSTSDLTLSTATMLRYTFRRDVTCTARASEGYMLV